MNYEPVKNHFVYPGDCVPIMTAWGDAFCPDFIFADPPFNIGEDYGETSNDSRPAAEFEFWTRTWLMAVCNMLRPGGVLAINVPDSMVRIILNGIAVECNKYEMQQIDWCIWHYRFGQHTKHKFIPSKTHCLIFRRGDTRHTWNPDSILVESLRSSQYNDKRIFDSEKGGMRVPFNVWTDIPRVVGNSRERVKGHPNQIPEAYLERLILAYTDPVDYVFDPFGGTGTTSAMAARHGRRSATIEINTDYCEDIISRVKYEYQTLNSPYSLRLE
jgi:site-specific DNA-methyltransferase (adenine-specific)